MSTTSEVRWSALLGYLNLSEGKPDPRFQQELNEAYRESSAVDARQPWQHFRARLEAELGAAFAAGSAAFSDPAQARAAIGLAFDHVLPAYRAHHRDLRFHLEDVDLFGPFFLARVFEAVLAQGPPWQDRQRIVDSALFRLNDFLGHRPVAILEGRGKPYGHERVRPIPLYLRQAGVAYGRYNDLLSEALKLLQETDGDLLAEAHFDLELLDEWAVDPRAYDHGHPANRRPNYVFGEWDPDCIDGGGRYRRFVGRLVVLEALLAWAKDGSAGRLLEAAAVLAGTTLMAAGISGWGPSAHGAEATLAVRMPPVARCRDAFYEQLLRKMSGAANNRLRQESARLGQPFGGVRQHLNHALARDRAFQLQQRRLAVLFARMGQTAAARQEAERIAVAAVRFWAEIHAGLAMIERRLDQERIGECVALLKQTEALLQRGIGCGAIVDPWNILGFQGQFPLAAAREDSVRDPRVDELLTIMASLFDLYSLAQAGAAGRGQQEQLKQLRAGVQELAVWWDRFATSEVADLPRVHGGELSESAQQVATALARWHADGDAAGDLAFWRLHVDDFRSPDAFARVIEALLERHDLRASMALLMAWLSQAEQVPLEEGERSFHALAVRWLRAATRSPSPEAPALVRKFFDLLEVNAEELWQVPALELAPDEVRPADHDDALFAAAYEGVTYRDSADDDPSGEVLDGGPPAGDFALEYDADAILKRLRFLALAARLWRLAAEAAGGQTAEALAGWRDQAKRNRQDLLRLLDAVHGHAVPPAVGSPDSLIEYDRRVGIKATVVNATIHTCLETLAALRALHPLPIAADEAEEPYEPPLRRLGQALAEGRSDDGRAELAACLGQLGGETIVFVPIFEGGSPIAALRAQSILQVLHHLGRTLSHHGLFRGTFELLNAARHMERDPVAVGRRVTEFHPLFESAFQSVVQAVIQVSSRESISASNLVEFLESVAEPFLALWIEHSRTLRLSELELLSSDPEWEQVRQFIRRYGRDLFHARFMTLANLRGIVRQGVDVYLNQLVQDADPLHPVRLVEELDGDIRRERAVRWLDFILRAVIENYEDYRDFNTTAAQSDYGDNLHVLLDFLRLKWAYQRQAWHFRPLLLAHELLCRAVASSPGRETAALWQEGFDEMTRTLADRFSAELQKLEQTHGVRLAGVADHLAERFTRPLSLARLASLVEPALREEGSAAFAVLRGELRPYTQDPGGSGLEAPAWLRRLEAEVDRVCSKIADHRELEQAAPPTYVTWEWLQRSWNESARGR